MGAKTHLCIASCNALWLLGVLVTFWTLPAYAGMNRSSLVVSIPADDPILAQTSPRRETFFEAAPYQPKRLRKPTPVQDRRARRVPPDAKSTNKAGSNTIPKVVKRKPINPYHLPLETKYKLHVKVDLPTQRMYVYRHGRLKHIWAISGGTQSYPTPVGSFSVERMYPMFIATNWDRAEMPHSLFFHGDYAIHGTDKINKLGGPASHGCVRIHPINAALLYKMVERYGRSTRVEIRS